MDILIVENEPGMKKAFNLVLNSEGHKLTNISDGKDALRMIEENKYDLILLDLGLPSLKGDKILKKLSDKGIVKERKIVVITASPLDEKEIDKLSKLGAHSILMKKELKMQIILDKINEIQGELD